MKNLKINESSYLVKTNNAVDHASLIVTTYELPVGENCYFIEFKILTFTFEFSGFNIKNLHSLSNFEELILTQNTTMLVSKNRFNEEDEITNSIKIMFGADFTLSIQKI